MSKDEFQDEEPLMNEERTLVNDRDRYFSSVYQDVIHCKSNGTKRMPAHLGSALTIKHLY